MLGSEKFMYPFKVPTVCKCTDVLQDSAGTAASGQPCAQMFPCFAGCFSLTCGGLAAVVPPERVELLSKAINMSLLKLLCPILVDKHATTLLSKRRLSRTPRVEKRFARTVCSNGRRKSCLWLFFF